MRLGGINHPGNFWIDERLDQFDAVCVCDGRAGALLTSAAGGGGDGQSLRSLEQMGFDSFTSDVSSFIVVLG